MQSIKNLNYTCLYAREESDNVISYLKKIRHSDIAIFTLLNISNIGSQEKQLKQNDTYKEIFNYKNTQCNWIYQSFEKEVKSEEIEEGLKYFFDLSNEFRKSGKWLLNHENPIYNILSLKLQNLKNYTNNDIREVLKITYNEYPYLLGKEEKNSIDQICKYFLNN